MITVVTARATRSFTSTTLRQNYPLLAQIQFPHRAETTLNFPTLDSLTLVWPFIEEFRSAVSLSAVDFALTYPMLSGRCCQTPQLIPG
jgi:hypothetical protein